jgi:23S rRNA (cytosine1962-C5)-methyltransferase
MILESKWNDYELIDAGGSRKLERWGKVVTIRPEVNAYFPAKKTLVEWRKEADWEFVENGKQKSGAWKALKKNPQENWMISHEELRFNLKLTKFKHVGLFPEQEDNWRFIEQNLKPGDRFLNLFAYTGAASIVAKSCHADVIHVDAVKQLISWAKENMVSSQLENIRWVHDDAFKFAKRCAKREQQFDCIIMDPPAFGLGANKERWKIEDKLEELLKTANAILAPKGKLIVNTYTPKLKLQELNSMTKKVFSKEKTTVDELWRTTSTGKKLYFGNFIRVEKQ